MSRSRAISQTAGNLTECLHLISRSAAFQKALIMGSSDDEIPYVQPLLDVVDLFEELKIGYAMIGGVAAMYYGRSRFTDEFEFVASNDFGSHECCDTNGIQIDVWKDEFSNGIISRSREVDLAGRKVRIADPHDLIAMKLRAGRLQDDYDISEILKHQKIDDAIIQARVQAEEFQHYLDVKKRN
jgi:hypothetical protein